LRATKPEGLFEIPADAFPGPSSTTAIPNRATRTLAAHDEDVNGIDETAVNQPASELPQANPFRHDWDLALKRAREEAQGAQRNSGTHPIASAAARIEPRMDPAERAVIEFESGLECMSRNDLEGALRAWECALEYDPHHRVCRANLNLLKKKIKPSI
jgi:hypothetical protein